MIMLNKNVDFTKYDNINERIKNLRKLARLPRSYFEIKYQLSEDTLKKWESQNYKLAKSSIDRIINIFKSEDIIVTKEWLNEGSGQEPVFFIPDSNVVNVKSEKKKNLLTIDPKLPDEIKTAKEIEIISGFYANTVYTYINDESMLPIYTIDSCVIGIKKYENFIDCAGKDCIVKIKELEHPVFRRVIFNDNNVFSLCILNHAEIANITPILHNVNIEFIAPVKWIIK